MIKLDIYAYQHQQDGQTGLVKRKTVPSVEAQFIEKINYTKELMHLFQGVSKQTDNFRWDVYTTAACSGKANIAADLLLYLMEYLYFKREKQFE